MSKGILGVENMRGDREIIHTKTFLANDLEETRWRFVTNEKLVKLCIKFIPTTEIVSQPPIRVFGEGDETNIEFKGWNGNLTYSIESPIHLMKINNINITFSIVNMHLGTSNYYTMQVYSEYVD